MYLLLILLVSPAFGRPSSDQLDVGGDISNLLDDMVNFNNETGKMLLNPSLTEEVAKMLLEAEQKILEMQAELKILESDELQFKDNYFPEFNKAKSYVRETRQDLRKLAHSTVTDVRDLKLLLEALDETNDTVFLKASINRMKEMMIKTRETLKEAKKTYNNALETFENLISSIRKQNKILKKMATKDTPEYKAWTAKFWSRINGQIAASTVGCIIVDVFGGLGICSAISAGVSIDAASKKAVEVTEYLAKLEKITYRMLNSTNDLDQALNVAIDILTEEIELMGIWTQRAKTVSDNIEEYKVEILRKVKTVRNIFIRGLDDLKTAAEKFLAQPKDIFNID